MKSEKEKMLTGEPYDPLDAMLTTERQRARTLLQALNAVGEDQDEQKRHLLRELLPRAAPDFWLQPPFYCDYGSNIVIGEKVFMNFNCVLLDVALIRIGART